MLNEVFVPFELIDILEWIRKNAHHDLESLIEKAIEAGCIKGSVKEDDSSELDSKKILSLQRSLSYFLSYIEKVVAKKMGKNPLISEVANSLKDQMHAFDQEIINKSARETTEAINNRKNLEVGLQAHDVQGMVFQKVLKNWDPDNDDAMA